MSFAIRRAGWRDSRQGDIRVTKLFMRAALANLDKSHAFQNRYHLSGFKNRKTPHASGNGHRLRADVLCLQRRFTIFEEHFNDFTKIAI